MKKILFFKRLALWSVAVLAVQVWAQNDSPEWMGAMSPPPAASVNIPAPVFRWKFSEGSGTSLADSSGNGNTGTITTSLGSWNTATIGGIASTPFFHFATAAVATGSSAVTAIAGTQNATMTCWVKGGVSGDAVVGPMNTSNYRLGILATTSTVYCCVENGAVNSPNVTVTLGSTVWHFLVMTFDGTQTETSQVHLYLDGTLQSLTGFSASVSTLASTSNQGHMLVGRDIADSVFGSQSTTDVQWFGYTMGQSEVTTRYNLGPQQ